MDLVSHWFTWVVQDVAAEILWNVCEKKHWDMESYRMWSPNPKVDNLTDLTLFCWVQVLFLWQQYLVALVIFKELNNRSRRSCRSVKTWKRNLDAVPSLILEIGFQKISLPHSPWFLNISWSCWFWGVGRQFQRNSKWAVCWAAHASARSRLDRLLLPTLPLVQHSWHRCSPRWRYRRSPMHSIA